MKLLFWLALIITLVYFSGDLKYKDKSLKSWVMGLIDGGAAKKLGDGSDLLKDVNHLINKAGTADTLSDPQIKQVEKLIDERLSKKDQDSLQKLMKNLNGKEEGKPAAADAKSDKNKPKSKTDVTVKKIAKEAAEKPVSSH